MKKTTLFLFIALFSCQLFAQQKMSIPYSRFETWAKQIKLTGYTLMECENDGGVDYTAMFMSGSDKFLQIRVGSAKLFKSNTSAMQNATAYVWNGYKAVYSFQAGMTLMIFEVPESDVCFTLGLMGKAEKAVMEDIASKINPKSFK